MDTDVQRYLADLLDAAHAALGSNLIGAYAAGSIAFDAYLPGRSDVDVALVCEESLDPERRLDLISRLRHEALPCPARGLELVLYRREVAQSGTPEAGFELELNSGPRMQFRATNSVADRPAADGLFWYALDRSILHQRGLAVLGAAPEEMFADLSSVDLHRLLIDALHWWLALPTPSSDQPAPGAEDAVLGACRSLVTFRCGVWLDKVGAGRHLIAAGDPSALIEQSIEARSGGQPPTGREARAFQQRVIDEVSAGPTRHRFNPASLPARLANQRAAMPPPSAVARGMTSHRGQSRQLFQRSLAIGSDIRSTAGPDQFI